MLGVTSEVMQSLAVRWKGHDEGSGWVRWTVRGCTGSEESRQEAAGVLDTHFPRMFSSQE